MSRFPSGRLEVGQRVQREWEMYDVSVEVIPRAIEPNARIVIEWLAGLKAFLEHGARLNLTADRYAEGIEE